MVLSDEESKKFLQGCELPTCSHADRNELVKSI